MHSITRFGNFISAITACWVHRHLARWAGKSRWKRKDWLRPRRGAVRIRIEIQIRDEWTLPKKAAANYQNRRNSDGWNGMRPIQMSTRKRANGAEMIDPVAIRMDAMVQRRAGCKNTQGEHSHKSKRHRDRLGSPAKNQKLLVSPHELCSATEAHFHAKCKHEKCQHSGIAPERHEVIPFVTGSQSPEAPTRRSGEMADPPDLKIYFTLFQRIALHHSPHA
jgi:hypothetical protein